jgi:Carboxypeptidase regulatory-like domain
MRLKKSVGAKSMSNGSPLSSGFKFGSKRASLIVAAFMALGATVGTALLISSNAYTTTCSVRPLLGKKASISAGFASMTLAVTDGSGGGTTINGNGETRPTGNSTGQSAPSTPTTVINGNGETRPVNNSVGDVAPPTYEPPVIAPTIDNCPDVTTTGTGSNVVQVTITNVGRCDIQIGNSIEVNFYNEKSNPSPTCNQPCVGVPTQTTWTSRGCNDVPAQVPGYVPPVVPTIITSGNPVAVSTNVAGLVPCAAELPVGTVCNSGGNRAQMCPVGSITTILNNGAVTPCPVITTGTARPAPTQPTPAQPVPVQPAPVQPVTQPTTPTQTQPTSRGSTSVVTTPVVFGSGLGAAINLTYGQVLSGNIALPDTTNCASVTYSHSETAILEPMTFNLVVTCNPKDTVNNTASTMTYAVSISVGSPSVSWLISKLNMVEGESLSAEQLNGSVSLSGNPMTDKGKASYSLADGRKVTVGSVLGAPGTYQLTFSWVPDQPSRYKAVSVTKAITVDSKVVASNPSPVVAPQTKPAVVIVKPKPAQVKTTTKPANAAPAPAPANPVPTPVPELNTNNGVLEIKDFTVKSVTKTSVTLAWTTNKPTKSQIDYGPDDSFGYTEVADGFTIDHTVTLKNDNIKAGSRYFGVVKAIDEKGATISTDRFVFTTEGNTIELRLTDASGKPLVGAKVTIDGTDETGTTDAQGLVTFTGLRSGKLNYKVTKDGKEYSGVLSVSDKDGTQSFVEKTTIAGKKTGKAWWWWLLVAFFVLLLIGLIWFVVVWLLGKRRGGNDGGSGYYDNNSGYGSGEGSAYPSYLAPPDSSVNIDQNGAPIYPQNYETNNQYTPQMPETPQVNQQVPEQVDPYAYVDPNAQPQPKQQATDAQSGQPNQYPWK